MIPVNSMGYTEGSFCFNNISIIAMVDENLFDIERYSKA